MNIENIYYEDVHLALILRKEFKTEGIQFFTPNSYSQQLGYMNRPKGHIIKPHVHNPVSREVLYTNEVLIIKSGKVKVDFYAPDQKYVQSTVLEAGDIILLIMGGHGFEMLEHAEIIEVKQGPYVNEFDKTRFDPE